jgi:uncharacterized integral membrane protein
MKHTPSMESALFRNFWEEGLLDLLVGLALLVAGIGWHLFGPLAVLQAPLWVILWNPLRERLVEPRSGYVCFSQARQRRNTRQLGSSLLLGAGMLAAVALIVVQLPKEAEGAVAHEQWIAGLPALLVALGLALGGLLTSARRFYAYGAFFLLAAMESGIRGWEPSIALGVGGILILLVAIIRLTRFLRASRAFETSAST